MTEGNQSRENLPSLTAELLTPKSSMRIHCWNVRTLNQTGELAHTLTEMKRYISLLAVTEVRWTKTGKQRLAEEVIVWSGRHDDNHQEEFSIIIGKEHTKALMKWKPINE